MILIMIATIAKTIVIVRATRIVVIIMTATKVIVATIIIVVPVITVGIRIAVKMIVIVIMMPCSKSPSNISSDVRVRVNTGVYLVLDKKHGLEKTYRALPSAQESPGMRWPNMMPYSLTLSPKP